jgi:hypothetical protein
MVVELNEVELSSFHAIAYNKIIYSSGRIMDLDLKIPCHMDRVMRGNFLMMDDMLPDNGTAMKSQWMTVIMEVSNDAL